MKNLFRSVLLIIWMSVIFIPVGLSIGAFPFRLQFEPTAPFYSAATKRRGKVKELGFALASKLILFPLLEEFFFE